MRALSTSGASPAASAGRADWPHDPQVGNAEPVPWCETCDRFYNPNTLQADGSCRTCGRPVAPAERTVRTEAEGRPKAPWHFKLLVAATVIYLAYRLVQGVIWVAGRL